MVVDTKTSKLAAIVDVGKIPHPRPRRQLQAPASSARCGRPRAWVTSASTSSVPIRPRKAARLEGGADAQGPGRRFAVHQDHPKSTNLWVDTALNPDPKISQSVAVFDIRDLSKPPQIIDIAACAKIADGRRCQARGAARVQPEGRRVWFSVWSAKNKQSAIVVVDDKTRTCKTVLNDKRLITPTGKFNVWNTQHDVY